MFAHISDKLLREWNGSFDQFGDQLLSKALPGRKVELRLLLLPIIPMGIV